MVSGNPPCPPEDATDGVAELATAPSVELLARAYRGARASLAASAHNAEHPRRTVGRLSALNDAAAQRALELVAEPGLTSLRDRVAILALGSVGRREQSLATDHDSAGVYEAGLSSAEARAFAEFAGRAVAALEAVGLTPCPRHTTAANPAWRKDLDRWRDDLDRWIAIPTQEHMVRFGMFQDLRTVFGNSRFEAELQARIRDAVARSPRFLPHLARNIVRFPPPLGAFGRLRLERGPEHRGTLNVKKAGLFAITEGVSLLALEAGIQDGSTWDKLEALAEQEVAPCFDLAGLAGAFSFLVGLRLAAQFRAESCGTAPSNYLDPAELGPGDLEQLRNALRTVAGFLRCLGTHFQLQWFPG